VTGPGGKSRQLLTIPVPLPHECGVPLPHECGVPGGLDAALAFAYDDRFVVDKICRPK
jgi:hypothetical protein